ncbi:prolipoprotein diacylglyceryl transferase family protein [Butyrivibrio sp. AE2005]|uniref:prolipoprotein diacylglyceryl transferase family protein n=1 Tax=Butyrivibrio sp. AE2005 TaxID=1496722 RepID=UPI0009DFB128|nr:prolipoprotein diacylglyceryl transferase family protein [Butyrivibrio sp. AE2005]
MYRIMMLSAIFFGFSTASGLQKKKNVPLRIIGLSVVLEMILCMYMSFIGYLVITKGRTIGLNSTGAALGMILGVLIFSKITPQYKKVFFESYVIVLPLMYGLGKIGCAFAGCCAGIPFNGFMRVHTTNGNLFPIQKLEAVVFLLLFAGSLLLYFKDRFNPSHAVIIYCIAKIALDFLRIGHVDHLITTNQIMCAAIMAFFILYTSKSS